VTRFDRRTPSAPASRRCLWRRDLRQVTCGWLSKKAPNLKSIHPALTKSSSQASYEIRV